jgi:single stranded DNA-binding protein
MQVSSRIITVGNATKRAEVKRSERKVAYADFTLGVSRTKDQTTFFPIRVFGRLAESCEKVKKRVKVLADGKLDISEYTDKEGQKRVTFRILADTYRLLQTQRGGF